MILTKEVVQKRFEELEEEGRLNYCVGKQWIALTFVPKNKKIQAIFLIDYVYEFYALEDFNAWLTDAFSYLFQMSKRMLSLDCLLDKWKTYRVPHPMHRIASLFEKYIQGELEAEDIKQYNEKYGDTFC